MTTTRGIIDRFEGDYALIETEQEIIQIARDKLPLGSKEGDCVIIDGDTITIDHDATASRKTAMDHRLRSLFSK